MAHPGGVIVDWVWGERGGGWMDGWMDGWMHIFMNQERNRRKNVDAAVERSCSGSICICIVLSFRFRFSFLPSSSSCPDSVNPSKLT